MWALVRQRPHYRQVLVGSMISQLGDWLSYIAVSLLTVSSGEGGLALATAYLSHTLPTALVAPLAGRVADRYDRRKVMIGAYLASSAMTGLMMWAALRGEIWTLQALTCLRTSLSSFGMTARQAAIPALVSREELYSANALNSMIWSTLFTLGVALGGALSATLGATTAIGVDALTFLASILAIWSLPALHPAQALYGEAHADEPKGDQASEAPAALELKPDAGLWACWRFARRDAQLAAALLAKCPLGVINSAGWMTLTLMASQTFGDQTGATLGLFHASRAVGTGLGPLLLTRLWPRSAVASTMWAAPVTLCVLWSERLALSMACLLLWGMLLGYTWVRSSALVQQRSPHAALGRLSAFDHSASISCQAGSILIIGLIYDLGWGLSTGVYLMATLTLMIGLWLSRLERRDDLSHNS